MMKHHLLLRVKLLLLYEFLESWQQNFSLNEVIV